MLGEADAKRLAGSDPGRPIYTRATCLLSPHSGINNDDDDNWLQLWENETRKPCFSSAVEKASKDGKRSREGWARGVGSGEHKGHGHDGILCALCNVDRAGVGLRGASDDGGAEYSVLQARISGRPLARKFATEHRSGKKTAAVRRCAP